MSRTISYHDVLPPTTNMLDSCQRTRLVRSARKIGAVLGTTPKLVEVETEPEPIHITLLPIGRGPASRPGTSHFIPSHRGASPSIPSTPDLIYSSSSNNSSVASLMLSPRRSTDSERSIDSLASEPIASKAKHARSRSKPLPKPLILRLNAVPTLPSDPRVHVTPPTPLTPSVSSPTTPVPPSVAETRRRKMAKLQRTFGENIPVDAVFPPTQLKQHSALLMVRGSPPELAKASPSINARRRRSMSVDYAIAPQSVRPSSKVWVTGSGGWTGEWNRKDIREVQDQLRSLRL